MAKDNAPRRSTRLSTGAISCRTISERTQTISGPGQTAWTPSKSAKTAFKSKVVKQAPKRVVARNNAGSSGSSLSSLSQTPEPPENNQLYNPRPYGPPKPPISLWDPRFPVPNDEWSKKWMTLEKRFYTTRTNKDNFRLPTRDTAVYLDAKGNKLFDDFYVMKAQAPPIGKDHPKIKAAAKNDTWTQQLAEYWYRIKPSRNVPLAGTAKRGIFASMVIDEEVVDFVRWRGYPVGRCESRLAFTSPKWADG